MTAGSGLPSPPLKLPELNPVAASPSTPSKRTSASTEGPRKSSFVVVDGAPDKASAVKLTRRSSVPLARTSDLAGASWPLLRRRSGDFSLPVRYKYVIIPGNNSRAVLAAFRRRPWWGPARKEEDVSAAAVVRSSFVSRRKKGGRKNARDGTGNKVGYSNKTFNVWWEMYASRSVIEGTNLNANVRQAVNHFEFNDVLVSKKGLWQSLRAYCASMGVPVTTVVPQTFFLSGGAVRSATPASSRKNGPGNSSTEVEDGESNGNGGGGGDDDRAKFLAFCAEPDGESGASSFSSSSSSFSSFSGGLSGSPETMAASPVEPELTAASKIVAARQTLSQTSPNSTAAAEEEEEEVEAAAVEGVTCRPCSPESDEPSACHPSRNPSTAARGAASPSGKPVAESTFLAEGGAESCPPHTVLRSASPPLPPLSPSSSPCGRCPPGCSPEALEEESPPRRRGEDILPNGGPVSLDIDTLLPAERDRGSKKCGHSGRGGGARERQGALEGQALVEGQGGAAQRKGAAANRSGGQPKKIVKGTQINDELGSGTAVAEAKRNRTAKEKTERTRRTSAGVRPTWVVKPAANTNCGFGIQVCCSLKEVLGVVDAEDNRAGRSGWVVQQYIERPLLVRRRKFDIRLFVLLVADPSTRSWTRKSKSSSQQKLNRSNNSNSNSNSNSNEKPENHDKGVGGSGQPMKVVGAGKGVRLPEGEEQAEVAPADGSNSTGAVRQQPPSPLRAWCHQDAYVRTSSVRYSNDPSKVKDKFVHLTNNAVQRRSPSYGQDEPGNKLTLADLQEWLDGDESGHKGKACGWVEQTLRPRMHSLAATSVAAAATAGINKRGRPYAFELLGYDFMVDDDLRVWLIEVNSNPCLEFVCPLLQGAIVRVIDDTLSIALDSVFRPPEKHRRTAVATGLGGAASEDPGNGFRRVYPATE